MFDPSQTRRRVLRLAPGRSLMKPPENARGEHTECLVSILAKPSSLCLHHPHIYISKPSTGACLQYSAVFKGRDFRAVNHLWVVVEQRTMMNARLIADLDKTKRVLQIQTACLTCVSKTYTPPFPSRRPFVAFATTQHVLARSRVLHRRQHYYFFVDHSNNTPTTTTTTAAFNSAGRD